MAKKAGLGSAKRFGVRYGRTTKFNFAQIENQQRKPQKCPHCKKPKAHRVFAGVYVCDLCGAKFTGKAYFLEQVIRAEKETVAVPVTEAVEEAVIEEEVE